MFLGSKEPWEICAAKFPKPIAQMWLLFTITHLEPRRISFAPPPG